MEQQTLSLKFEESIQLDDLKSCSFFREISIRCENFLKGNDHLAIFLGKEDIAKSFFFLAFYNYLNTKHKCIYFSLKKSIPSINLKVDEAEIIFMDGYNHLFNSEEGEKKLFNLFNLSKEKKIKVFFNNSLQGPQVIKLDDLNSRLSSSLQVDFPVLSDNDKKIIVINFLKKRGLLMKEQSIDFILKRHSRNLNDLIELSIKLDEISLEQKKNITIPLIKEFTNL
jgi:chromosomal replication initiation ATPase DnaA